MRTFSIAELERYSLIKAHTFRMWEHRFAIVESQRTPSNQRCYTLQELSFLLNFSLLNRFGTRVSELAALTKNAVEKRVQQFDDPGFQKQHQINRLVLSMHALEIENFEFILDGSVAVWGMEATLEEIVLPFLERLAFFSCKGRTTADRQLVMAVLRRKLVLAIEQAQPKTIGTRTVLLFLPEGEHFDLLLLYLHYQLRRAGFQVLYLGANVAAGNLHAVIRGRQPQFVVAYVPPKEKRRLQKLQSFFTVESKETPFLIATGGDVEHNDPCYGQAPVVCYRDVLNRIRCE